MLTQMNIIFILRIRLASKTYTSRDNVAEIKPRLKSHANGHNK